MSRSNSQRELLERELLARPVAGLQYMLGQLAREDGELTTLAVDGVFGARTLEAVLRFQRRARLPVTGVVDRQTWDAIRDRWQAQEASTGTARPVRLFPSEGTRVEAGDRREYLILPQAMFQVLGRQFEGVEADRPDGVHGPASVRNAQWLQRAAGLPGSGAVDLATWEALSRLYEIFVVREGEGSSSAPAGWG